MICKNCGTKNKEGATYCSYCGKSLNDNDWIYEKSISQSTGSSTNIIKIIAIVVSIVLVLGGGFILLKDSIFRDDTYVFDVNKTVIIRPKINSLSNKVDLIYKLDDSSVANIVKLDNSCSIVGLREQGTNLNICEGDKILKVVKIAFKNESTSG